MASVDSPSHGGWLIQPDPDIHNQTGSLVASAQAGDKSALSSLLARYESRVMRIVRRRLGPGLREYVESGDVCQDVMIQVIRGIDGFSPRRDSTFLRWLCGVVENRLRNIYRKQRSMRLETTDADQLERVMPQDGEDPESRFEEQRRRQFMAEAMNALPSKYRTVLELRSFARLSYREIGEQLARSEDAAWMLHRRARAALTVEYKRLERDPA